MGTTVSQRLRLFIDAAGNQSIVAKKLGMTHSTISGIIRKNSAPSYKVIAGLFENYPGLNERWFILGEGEMWKDQMQDNTSLSLLEDSDQYYANLKRSVVSNDGSIEAIKLEYLVDMIKSKDEAIEAQKMTIQALKEQVENFKKTA